MPASSTALRKRRASRAAAFALFASIGICIGFVPVAEHPARAAEGRTSSLSWLRMPGADACIATQALARAVEDRLGRPGRVFVSAAQADVSVEGRIEKKKRGPGWYAVIHVRDANGALLGTRELDRDDVACDAMNERLTLVIAVMIDPEAALAGDRRDAAATTPPSPAGSEPAGASTAAGASGATGAAGTGTTGNPPPLPPPTDPPTGPAPSPDRPMKPTPPKEPWRFEGGGDLEVAAGLTPSTAIGAGVEAILYPPGIPVGFRGFTTLFLPTTASKDDARATFDMLYIGGSLCPTYRGRVANLMVCLGGQLGVLRPRADVQNRGISEDPLPLWNVLGEFRMSVPLLHPIGASVGVGGAVPLLRSEVDYTTQGGGTAILHKVSPAAAMADVGLGFVFP